ncbi:hypothetical protein H4582DRAFT_1811606, partial [Lactarius indigo]
PSVTVVERPYKWNPPVVLGVIPAYDQALAYIRSDFDIDAATQSGRRHASAKHKECVLPTEGPEDAKKWLSGLKVLGQASKSAW